MLTVLHASDLQCGRPYVAVAGEALIRFAHRLEPDVVVLSGDLTQRAKLSEFEAAMRLVEGLPDVPVVVTPGNHDVPLYRVWERAFTPFRNWMRVVDEPLDAVTSVGGATIVALSSAAPRKAIVNGRLGRDQLGFAREAFRAAPHDDVKVVVVHHHFVPTPDGRGGAPLPGALEHVRAFSSMGADLVLGGHVHQTHVTTSRAIDPGADRQGLPLISCGTTTSRRGRGPETGVNSLNLIRVRSGEIEVVPHLRGPDAPDFEPADPILLPRRPVPGTPAVSPGSDP